MRRFRVNTEVRIGPGALATLDECAGRPVLLVTDEFLSGTRLFAEVKAQLGDPVVFAEVVPNPTVATVAAGVKAYLEAHPDVVVAYGGGSVLDAAKAIHKAALDMGHGAPGGLVAVPTTSGSGSEVTSYAVVTDEQNHTKVPLVSPDLVARLAILDPATVVGVPPEVTADSGMDVLTHAVEAYVSREASDFSDALAEKATSLVFAHLGCCYDNGEDIEARSRMHNASCLAAMAFDNAGLGITHSLAHALGGRFDVAHGRLNAVLLPHVVAFNAERSGTVATRYAALGKLVSPSSTGRAGVIALRSGIERLREAVGIPPRLAGCGVDPGEVRRELDLLAQSALDDGCTPANPVPVTLEDLRGILSQVI